jgi:hypothetical protein
LAACGLALIFVQYLFFVALPGSLFSPFRQIVLNAGSLLNPSAYFRAMNEVCESNRQKAALPHIREIVGSKPVGCFGQYPIYVLLNDLNYRPAPLFLSYTAATGPMMQLNQAFYLSPSAPEFVLFSLAATDRKFPPLEDALAMRILLCNYDLAAAENGLLLLRHRAHQPPGLKLLSEGNAAFSERLDLTHYGTNKLWLELNLKPSLLGRLREFNYRAPTTRLAAWREARGGLLLRKRAPAAALRAGFLASPLLATTAEVERFYSGDINRPGAYSVEAMPGEEKYWRGPVHFRVFAIQGAAN